MFLPFSLFLILLRIGCTTGTKVNQACVSTAKFDAGYGNCETYTSPKANFNFCSSDKDKSTGVHARDACPQCGVCQAPEPVLCVDDHTTFATRYGNCQSYQSNLGSKLTNFKYCSKDRDLAGLIARDVCPQCGVCSAVAASTTTPITTKTAKTPAVPTTTTADSGSTTDAEAELAPFPAELVVALGDDAALLAESKVAEGYFFGATGEDVLAATSASTDEECFRATRGAEAKDCTTVCADITGDLAAGVVGVLASIVGPEGSPPTPPPTPFQHCYSEVKDDSTATTTSSTFTRFTTAGNDQDVAAVSFAVEITNECESPADYPADITLAAKLQYNGNSGSSGSVVTHAVTSLLDLVPASSATDTKSITSMLDGALGSLSSVLALDDLLDSASVSVAGRPVHGLVLAEAALPNFFDMKLTLVAQAHFLEAATKAAAGGVGSSSAGGHAALGCPLGSDTALAGMEDGDAANWQKWVGYAITLTKGSDADTASNKLGAMLGNLVGQHGFDNTTFVDALRVLDNIDFGISFSGESSLTGLGGTFALPAPFDGDGSMDDGLSIKAAVDSSVLPPKGSKSCDVICALLHEYFEATAADDTVSSELSIAGNIKLSADDDSTKAVDGVEFGLKFEAGDFSYPILKDEEDGTDILTLTGIAAGVSAKLSPSVQQVGASAKTTLTWTKPASTLKSSSSSSSSSGVGVGVGVGLSTTAGVFPYHNVTANTVQYSADAELMDASYFTNYGGPTIDFKGEIAIKGGNADGKASVSVGVDFKMEGMYMNAFESPKFHMGDLRLAAKVKAKPPYLEKISGGGRMCLGSLIECVMCIEEGNCDHAISMTGYVNIAASNPFVYAFAEGEVSIAKMFEIAIPDIEFPAFLNLLAIAGVSKPTMRYNEETWEYEQGPVAAGAGFSFAVADTSIPIIGADGKESTIAVSKGLLISGGVTLFPNIPDINWTVEAEVTVGDIFSMVIPADWSVTLRSDPIDFTVDGVSILKLYEADESGSTDYAGRAGPVLQLSANLDLLTKVAGGIGMVSTAQQVTTDLAALAVGAVTGQELNAEETAKMFFEWIFGHNDFYGEMNVDVEIFGVGVGVKLVLSMGKLLGFKQVHVGGAFTIHSLVEISLPKFLDFTVYKDAVNGVAPSFSARVQGFLDAPELQRVQDAVVSGMVAIAFDAEQAFEGAAAAFNAKLETYETVTLRTYKEAINSARLNQSQTENNKTGFGTALAGAQKLAQSLQADIDAAQQDLADKTAEYALWQSGVCNSMGTSDVVKIEHAEAGSARSCASSKVAETCKKAKSCPVKSPCSCAFGDIGCAFSCIGGFFANTVTSIAECGFDTIVDIAECGFKLVEECTEVTISEFGGAAAAYITDPGAWCHTTKDGLVGLQQALGDLTRTIARKSLGLVAEQKSVDTYQTLFNSAGDALVEIQNTLLDVGEELLNAPTLALKGLHEGSKAMAKASSVAGAVIKAGGNAFQLDELFVNVTLSADPLVPCNIHVNIFGLELNTADLPEIVVDTTDVDAFGNMVSTFVEFAYGEAKVFFDDAAEQAFNLASKQIATLEAEAKAW